ncbi:histidine phosphatase family protein [Solibacillus sp. FSL H8-0538]|uniref:histidine phosphatase family protein n=1 Tax=Solibacillus sp. FSL H8-0538 TaxID=2921400 RepID=UPI0030F799D4
MTTICFIRHGQTDWNVEGRMQGQQNVPLNAIGKQQAQNCAIQLCNYKWDQLMSSPLLRAVQTADILSQHLGLRIQLLNEFAEKSYGEAEGLTTIKRQLQFPNGSIPGEENGEVLQQRVLDGISELCIRFPQQQLLVVTHGDIIALIVDYYFNKKIIPQNTSMTRIQFTGKNVHLLPMDQLG